MIWNKMSGPAGQPIHWVQRLPKPTSGASQTCTDRESPHHILHI